MGPFEAAMAAYYELRGRLAAGQLSAAEFHASVDGLLLRHGGRYWRLASESGRWQAYEAGQWHECDPSLPSRRSRSSTARAVVVAGVMGLLLVGLLWWEPPRLPVASMAVAESPPLPGAPPTIVASVPDAAAGGPVVEQAFQLLVGRTPAASDFDMLKPILAWEARLRPWAIQFLRWPAQEHLRLVDYAPPSLDPGGVPVLRAQAVGVYQAEGGGRVRVRWAFTLVPEDDEWRIKSISLAGFESGVN